LETAVTQLVQFPNLAGAECIMVCAVSKPIAPARDRCITACAA